MTKSVPILMYHAVAENPSAATRRLSVTPRSLDEQIAFLVDRRSRSCPPSPDKNSSRRRRVTQPLLNE